LILNRICSPLFKPVTKIASVAYFPVFPYWRLKWRTKPAQNYAASCIKLVDAARCG